MDLFLDQDATTAMIDPSPIPPSIALLLILFFSDSAKSSDEVKNREKNKIESLIPN